MAQALPIVARRPEVAFPRLQLPKLELLFKDGSMLWLRQVGTDWLTRSIDHQGEVIEVDLRHLAPGLDAEVYAAAEHDRPAVIFFTLRQLFSTACDFVQAVLALPQSTRSH